MPASQTNQENCVSHLPSLVPVPGRDIITQAWYQAGVSVIDFTDSANPKEIGYYDRGPISGTSLVLGGLWSSYYYNGRIFGSEIARGFDVWNLTPTAELSSNEIAAAAEVQFDRLTPQHQTQFTNRAELRRRPLVPRPARAGRRRRREDARPDRQVHRPRRALRRERTGTPRRRRSSTRSRASSASRSSRRSRLRSRRSRTPSSTVGGGAAPPGSSPPSPHSRRDPARRRRRGLAGGDRHELALAEGRLDRRAAAALDPDEVPLVVGFLAGAPRQGRVGVGYATVFGSSERAGRASRRSPSRTSTRDRGRAGRDRERLRRGAARAARRPPRAAPPPTRRTSSGACSPASCGRARSPG